MFLLSWTLGFLLLAVLLAILGFGVLSAAAAGVAKILFYIFVFLFLISLIMRLAHRT